MQTFTVTPPNTCGLSVVGSSVVYIETAGRTTYAPDAAVFTEYLTPEDALTAALLIDPAYDSNIILGPLTLEPVNVSDSPVSALYGTSPTLNSEYSCTDPTATVTYLWKGPDGVVIGGATSSSYTISNVIPENAGTYTCEVLATKANGQTGSAESQIELTVTNLKARFTLTRSGSNISAGSFLFSSGFTTTDSSIYLIDDNLNVPFNPVGNGFETSSNELSTVDQYFDFRVNGTFVQNFTLPAPDGTYTFVVE